MELPNRVLVGQGVLSELGSLVRDMGFSRGLGIVSGTNVRGKLHQKLDHFLQNSEVPHEWVTVAAATMDEVSRVEGHIKRTEIDVLVGLGGGKSVDIAKIVAFRIGLHFLSVPTSASHDGISSPFASIKGLNKPYSLVAKPPVAILADVDVIASAPRRLLASGCGDLVAKMTAVKDWELAHEETGEYYGRYAASLAELSATLVMNSSKEIGQASVSGVRDVVEALISAGVAAGIAGSSRPCSGAEHLFSHALDVIAPNKGLHGEKCGLGTIMMAKLHGLEWEKIRESLSNVGAPTTARQLGIDHEEVIHALTLARSIRPDRYTILSKTEVGHEEASELAKSTGII